MAICFGRESAFLSFAVLTGVAAAVIVGLSAASGCSSPMANRNPTGEAFPAVVGQSLEKVRTELPGSLAGEPAMVLIGYKQSSQFDIDRWVMGLIQAGVGSRLIEVPTIPSLVASAASGWIDDGMRSGIPEEDWGAVVTLYGGAARPVAEFTGTERGRLARVLVLDGDGNVVWFDDKGYSARKAMEAAAAVEQLSAQRSSSDGR